MVEEEEGEDLQLVYGDRPGRWSLFSLNDDVFIGIGHQVDLYVMLKILIPMLSCTFQEKILNLSILIIVILNEDLAIL